VTVAGRFSAGGLVGPDQPRRQASNQPPAATEQAQAEHRLVHVHDFPDMGKRIAPARSTPAPSVNGAAVRAAPNRSPASGLAWESSCPVLAMPSAEPYRTWTTPASAWPPTSSLGTPTARSSKHSPLKSTWAARRVPALRANRVLERAGAPTAGNAVAIVAVVCRWAVSLARR
jgi:hypothetical protein